MGLSCMLGCRSHARTLHFEFACWLGLVCYLIGLARQWQRESTKMEGSEEHTVSEERAVLREWLYTLLFHATFGSRRYTHCRPCPVIERDGTVRTLEAPTTESLRALCQEACIKSLRISGEGQTPAQKNLLHWMEDVGGRHMRLLTYEDVRGIDSAKTTAIINDALQFVAAHPDVRKLRKALEPDMVIQLTGSNSATRDEALEHMIAEHGSVLAFHGSALCNFHSILRNGLSNKFTLLDHGIYGDGVYFSTDPMVSANFMRYDITPPQCTHPRLQGSIACMAVCEVALHPEVRRGWVKDSPHDELPETYMVVKHDSMMRGVKTV